MHLCVNMLHFTSSHQSLLHLPGPLIHPVLSSANRGTFCPEHQTKPGQFKSVPLQIVLSVPLHLVQGPWSVLIQGHLRAQHGVEAEVDIRGHQFVQQGVDPLCVGGTADEIADFGSQACGGGRSSLNAVVATSAKGQHTLEVLTGPQQTTLVDSQGTGIVQDKSSIL